MDTIGERLRHARKTAHRRIGLQSEMTQGQLGDRIGLTQGAVYKLESNKNKRGNVDVAKLMAAAEFMQCSFIWLATGQGVITNDDSDLFDKLEANCGVPFYMPDQLDSNQPEMHLSLPGSLACRVLSNTFYTLVTDNGIAGKANAGDMALVDPGAELRVGDFVLARLADKRLPVIRRIVERTIEDGQGGYTLKSLNDEFADRTLNRLDDLIGVVLEFRIFTREESSYKNRLVDGSAKIIQLVR